MTIHLVGENNSHLKCKYYGWKPYQICREKKFQLVIVELRRDCENCEWDHDAHI